TFVTHERLASHASPSRRTGPSARAKSQSDGHSQVANGQGGSRSLSNSRGRRGNAGARRLGARVRRSLARHASPRAKRREGLCRRSRRKSDRVAANPLAVGVILDTSLLIAAERRTARLDRYLDALGDEPIAISAITASELLHGCHRATDAGVRARRSAFVE